MKPLPTYIDPKVYEEILKYRRKISETVIEKEKRPPRPPEPGRTVHRKPINIEREGEISVQLVALWEVNLSGAIGKDALWVPMWGYSYNRPKGKEDFNVMLEETRKSVLGQAGGSDLPIRGPLDHYWKSFEFQKG